LAPGVQLVQTALPMQAGVAAGHAVLPIQLPLASQLWGTLPLHLT
jgi:hypothetical protein